MRRFFGCLGLLVVTIALVAVLVAGGGMAVFKSPLLKVRLKDPASIMKGQVRIVLPGDLWQREVARLFPLSEDVAGFVELGLDNPRFVPDDDPAWLRLRLDLEANVVQIISERFRGEAVLRTRLRFDPATRTVVLDDPQVVDLSFSGQMGLLVAALRQVISDAIAEELRGQVVVAVPEGGNWLQQRGAAHLRDVVVEDGAVVLVFGI